MNTTGTLSRRGFLRTAGAAACAVLAFDTATGQLVAAAAPGAPSLSAWLKVTPGNGIVVQVGQAEMGQGIATGLSAVLAEELDVAWDQVAFEFVAGRPEYHHPQLYKNEQITGGSRSMAAFYPVMRKAGASARAMLVAAAAQRWGVEPAACSTAEGFVSHTASGRKLGYGELAPAAARMAPPQQPAYKPREAWRLVGQPLHRLDSLAKSNGSAVFGIDVKVPGMLHAAVMHAPSLGAEVETLANQAGVEKLPGVRAVRRLPGAVGVVADHYWQAATALKALRVSWRDGPNTNASDASIAAQRLAGLSGAAAPAPGKTGDADAALAAAARVVEADLSVPFLAHAAMEPMACTARVQGDACELWLSTQAPTLDAIEAAKALGIDAAKVQVHPCFVGGGFGRRAGPEHVQQAVLLARAVGRPVKVIWSREEDVRADHLRPAVGARMKAALDARGLPTALRFRIAGNGYFAYARPALVKDRLDMMGVIGVFDAPYKVEHRHTDFHLVDAQVRIGAWRGTSNSHNTFFLEAFMDEVAHAGGQDPLQMRRELLKHDARALKVLDTIAEKAQWGRAAPGRFQGLAYLQAGRWQTRTAEVVELSKAADGRLRIERVIVVADSGLVVNPLLVRQNIEGGVIFSLAAALYGEINIEAGRVRQSNFHDYRVLRMSEVPPVEIHLIEGDDKPASFGEVSSPPLPAALVSAVFAATGQRVRSLPLSRSGVTFV